MGEIKKAASFGDEHGRGEIPRKSTKVHNTAVTSRKVFTDLTNEGRLVDEKKLVFKAVRDHGPITSRKLAEITGRERSSICRSLYDLLAEISPQIKEAFIEKCPVTNRRVKWYSSLQWKKAEPRQLDFITESNGGIYGMQATG